MGGEKKQEGMGEGCQFDDSQSNVGGVVFRDQLLFYPFVITQNKARPTMILYFPMSNTDLVIRCRARTQVFSWPGPCSLSSTRSGG